MPLSAAKEDEKIRLALLRCGCDPDSKQAEVGIVLADDLRENK